MIKVGIVGIGFMGWIHWLGYQRVKGVKIAAICDSVPKRLTGDWRDIKGNFGPQGEMVDLKKISTYGDFDELLADPEIDVVDLCLPPNMHAEATIKALKAGKHVFCEKPMSLKVADCKKMVAAAEKADKHLAVGHVLPFMPEYQQARKLIDSGKYGKLIGGSFKRVISDPKWLKNFYDPDRIGGPLLDLHVHDAHLIRLLFGMPTRLTSQGRMRGEVVEYCNTQFEFEDPSLVVSATSGVINQQGRGFTHGFEIHLEKATLQFELAVLADGIESMPMKVLTPTGKVTYPKLAAGDDVAGFAAEIKEVTRAIKSGVPSSILSGELARDAIVLCHKQTESILKRKTVRV